MKNRAVRIALFLLVVLAFAGAAYELAALGRRAATMTDDARVFEEKARETETALRELRAAQFAYVAAGQAPAFWTARGTALLSAIAGQLQQLATLEKAAVDAGLTAGGAGSAARDDFATVRRIDGSVQGYVGEEQRLLASDLVFNDLREAEQAVAAHIDEGRRQVAAGAAASLEQLRKMQIATAAGAALFAVLVLALLVPSGRRSEEAGTDPAVPPPERTQSAQPAAQCEPLQLEGELAEARHDLPAPTGRHAIDLKAAATLCTDFAQLREPAQVPALLQRVASLLDARGIIVWLDAAATQELRPALSFGYSPQALARIHPISRNDDNATAQAYREQTLRVVEEDALSNGAIAVPLSGPDGCVGVMAAEIRRGGEAHADVQAAAIIVAAQLATLVGGAPAADGVQG